MKVINLYCAMSCFALIASIGLSATATILRANEPIGETIDLFDGKSMTGWEGDPKYWRIENGAIVGEIPRGTELNHNTWLVWRGGELSDFDLELQFKITGAPAANSGIQFRAQVKDIDHVSGYQADLDMGQTWLGRIYDEHGRALLVERGTRVSIASDGKRQSEIFAPTHQYGVLFRENVWNEYRVVAKGEHIAVYINGTLFSEMFDDQLNEKDLKGQLAFQLHSGPETKIEFKNIELRHLLPSDPALDDFRFRGPMASSSEDAGDQGVLPCDEAGTVLNLDFESGTLNGWHATGNAFRNQPVSKDGISSRWAGQSSNKQGEFFVGGFEIVQDRGIGTLESAPFRITHPYASMLLSGGNTPATRVEVIRCNADGSSGDVLFTAVGNQMEQMRRVVADFRPFQGSLVKVKLVDESDGGWGHLNFDDFRFHKEMPSQAEVVAPMGRSTRNAILQHLVPNVLSKVDRDSAHPARQTLEQMYVEPGFSVDLIVAEPDLHQPMAFTFDARGRIWVVEGHCYPQKREAGQGLDRILIFEDKNGDGRFETRKIFAEGLNLVSGMAVGHGGVWVGAAPELLFIPDRDRDDKPDSDPVIVLDGFGYGDTHETLNSFIWGPDGWLYGIQGVFNSSLVGKPGTANQNRVPFQAAVWRYHPVDNKFEVFAHGGSNPWGLDYDQHGQFFMTHCRSFWGKGPTTHVIQGGYFWNQVNSGYPPYVSANAPASLPHMQNFLLASARYGHGEGGAGKPGTTEVYGGHSHVGTMIYQGDNWPTEYRHSLFTHNLHGHQMNRQLNRREAGGYNTIHAGRDMFLCLDPQFIGVDLKLGPDGSVYMIDWYDPRHCHNPTVEAWDRGNGRIYRLKFDATFSPKTVNYEDASDLVLAKAQTQSNDWDARIARLVLSERAAKRAISKDAIGYLLNLVKQSEIAPHRLRGLWTLHLTGQLTSELAHQILKDQDEYVRAWVIQLAVEKLGEPEIKELFSELLQTESSLFVRRYMASAAARLKPELAWKVIEALLGQPENQFDRELPGLIWFAMAPLMDKDMEKGLAVADSSKVTFVQDWAMWYAAKRSPIGREMLLSKIERSNEIEAMRQITILSHAIGGERGIAMPSGWSRIRTDLYESKNDMIRRESEKIGSAFGDELLLSQARRQLANGNANEEMIRHALELLESYQASENVEALLRHVDRPQVIRMLARYSDNRIATTLLDRWKDWSVEQQKATIETLASRTEWAMQLMHAIREKKIDKSHISSLVALQIHNLNDKDLQKELGELWGRVGGSSENLKVEIRKTGEAYKTAPLWAFELQKGKALYQQNCAACHQPDATGKTLAPSLAGTHSKGIDYLVENIIDPNSVIGEDFQARLIRTLDGQVITGLIESESETAISIRTATESVTVSKEDIEEIKVSQSSFMPLGLLDKLDNQQRIELLKYVMSL